MSTFQAPAPLAELLTQYRRPADIHEAIRDDLEDRFRAAIEPLLKALRQLEGVETAQLIAKYQAALKNGPQVYRSMIADDLGELVLDMASVHALLEGRVLSSMAA
jgi:hypothetical protein